jgi:hypothetical protein
MTAANRFPWTLAADGKAARHQRGAELVAKGDPAAVNDAMREAVAEHGLALALTTDAGRAWLQLGNFKRSNAGDAVLSYVESTHATVGCWLMRWRYPMMRRTRWRGWRPHRCRPWAVAPRHDAEPRRCAVWRACWCADRRWVPDASRRRNGPVELRHDQRGPPPYQQSKCSVGQARAR